MPRLRRAAATAALVTAVVALAGCASGVPVERQVVVPGGKFTAVQGEAALTVRTILPDDGGEVVGAACAVTSSLYNATLTTPSRLIVPNFGPQSPELFFDCRAGDLAGTARIQIATYWRDGAWAGYPGPYYGGPYGWGGGPYGWGWGAGYPVSEYPDVRVVMHPKG